MTGRGFKAALRHPQSGRGHAAHLEALEERRLLATFEVVAGQPLTINDVDGDRIKVIHKDYGGTQIFINDDTGAWEEIRTTGGKSDRTKLNIKVKQRGDGDGRLDVGIINGDEVFSIKAPDVDVTGNGIGFERIRHLTVGTLTQEAGLVTTTPSAKAMTIRVDLIDTTGTMVVLEDVKILKVDEWRSGRLEIGGGLLRGVIKGDFGGELLLDRGTFYDFTFQRRNFVTRTIKVKGLAQGEISMPRTFFQRAKFESGTAEGFSFLTSTLNARKIIVNGNLVGEVSMDRPLNKIKVDGDVSADVSLNSVNKVKIDGDLDGSFRIRENRKAKIAGDLNGTFAALFSKRVVIDGDMTGRATFLRSGSGDGVGVRKFVLKGDMNDAQLTARHNMGRIKVKGGMFNSHIAAGAHPNRLTNEFPENLDDLKVNDTYRSGSIRSVKIGYDNSGDTFFEQSYILGFEIQRVKLGYAAPAADDSNTFGVGALFLGSIRYKNTDGMTKSNDLTAFRITDGKFLVARIPGTYPANE